MQQSHYDEPINPRWESFRSAKSHALRKWTRPFKRSRSRGRKVKTLRSHRNPQSIYR